MRDFANLSQDFERTLQKCGVGKDGAKYLKMAIDPFHDLSLDVIGLPDGKALKSVVYDIRKEAVIDNGGLTGAFDVHICAHPLVTLDGLGSVDYDVVTSNGTSIATNRWGADLFRWQVVDTGVDTFDPSGAALFGSLGIGSVLQDVNIRNTNRFRVIGAAFEVHNTTATLEKSGAVCVYRYEPGGAEGVVTMKDSSFVTTHDSCPVQVFHGPPTNIAAAKQRGGVTFEAAEGCLVPIIPIVSGCDPVRPTANLPIVTSYWNQAAGKWEAYGNRTYANSSTANPSTTYHFSLGGAGAYFTGLSNASTLLLTTRVFLEVVPFSESTLMPMAMPTPQADLMVGECLDRITREMMPGYPVSMNAKGDFFRKALSVLRTVAKPTQAALAAVPNPYAQGAAIGLQKAINIEKAIKDSTHNYGESGHPKPQTKPATKAKAKR